MINSALAHQLPPIPDGAAPAALACRDLQVFQGGKQILDRVDLQVTSGEVVALVGPNGAGKSTLLAALAGDLIPTRGQIEVFGVPITDIAPPDLARRRSVMLQEHRVSFAFDVVDVVRMGRAPWSRGGATAHDDLVVDAAMATAGITHLARQSFTTLSGGEKARTAFARVLAQQTPAIMLDEPTAALDLGHAEHLLQTCRQLANDGAAVLVVLHDLNLAAAHADRAVIIADGGVVADGLPSQVFTSASLSAIYRHPVQVIDNPIGDGVLVLPERAQRTARRSVGQQAGSPEYTHRSPV